MRVIDIGQVIKDIIATTACINTISILSIEIGELALSA
jgi:hypothetical protein